jgi:two-component system sensor histidine kinase DesK
VADPDRHPPGGRTSADVPGVAEERSGVGEHTRVSRLYRVAALVFVAYPVLLLLYRRPGPEESLLVLAGTGVFIALLGFASSPPGGPRRSDPVGPVLVVLLLAIATALVVRNPNGGFYPFYFFASTGAATLSPPRRAISLMVLAGVLGGLALYWTAGEVASSVVQGLSVTIIGVTIFSAAEVRRTNWELVDARHELARLAVTEERSRIARDLHDTLGQSLSVIALKSQLAARLIADEPERARGEIEDVERVARESLDAVRQTVDGQRRPTLEAELEAARKVLETAGIAPTIETVEDRLPPGVDAVLAWTIREGVTNVVRHSGAHHVSIRIHRVDGWAEATITNDGGVAHDVLSSMASVGRTEPGAYGGFGLIGLSERIAALGGRFEAGPVPTGGFRLDAALPLDKAL